MITRADNSATARGKRGNTASSGHNNKTPNSSKKIFPSLRNNDCGKGWTESSGMGANHLPNKHGECDRN